MRVKRNPALLQSVIKRMMASVLRMIFGSKSSEPVEKAVGPAYDLWSASYDHQPGNLVFDMDEDLFCRFLARIDIKDKVVADIGCGTGRHWPSIFARSPSSLQGFDVSDGMLSRLKRKFPGADVVKIGEDGIPALDETSVDLVVSTLALGHIAEPEPALKAWCAALKRGGALILTDFHPEALIRGAKRTFVYRHKPVHVRSYVHPVAMVEGMLKENGLATEEKAEHLVDRSVRHYYEQKNALAVYEKFRGIPMVYGMICKKL